MKINNKILSVPPYISTAWKNIALLHVEIKLEHPVMIITLNNGAIIEIPHLEENVIEAIFVGHAKFLEQELPAQSKNPIKAPGDAPGPQFGFPLKIGPAGIENLGTALQHNLEQMDSPDIPKEILDKIVAISKAVGIDDPSLLPKGEPHCNCPHCQISRALYSDMAEVTIEQQPQADEEVSDDDLKFRLWDVAQTSDKLYQVTNPLDTLEQYQVFLGEPIGCTCGHKNCEHIRAVLSS